MSGVSCRSAITALFSVYPISAGLGWLGWAGWAGVELMRSLCGDSEEAGLVWVAGLLGWAGAREHDTPAASTEHYLAGED